MPKELSESEQKARFIARTKLARVTRFPKQQPILTILDLEQGTYKWYESRTPLPHRFIPKFCAACGVTMEWLLAEEGEGPAVVETTATPVKRARKAVRGRAA